MLIALPNAFGDAATNMAIDATLLESIPVGHAALRHYAWLEPAATFGYAQHYNEVAQTSGHSTTLIRRLTGGGIVDHRNDWTYALVIHHSLPCAGTPATELYQQIHRAISLSLKKMDIESHLAPCHKVCNTPHLAARIPHLAARIPHLAASQCFVTPSPNDVLSPDNQKIAGAAMKRNRHGLLIQGSLDRSALPDFFDFPAFQKHLLVKLATALSLPNGELEVIRPLFNSELIEREKLRFSSEAWNRKR
jgi:lipoate-protein ligase A